MRALVLLLCALVATPTFAAAKKKKPAATKKAGKAAKTKATPKAAPKPAPEPEPAPEVAEKKSTVLLDTNPAALAVQLEQALAEGFKVAAADSALPEELDRDAVVGAAKKARAVAVVTARYANGAWVVRTWSASDGGVLAEASFKAPKEGAKAVVPKPMLGKLLAAALKAESSAGESGAEETATASSSPKEKKPTPEASKPPPPPKEKDRKKEPEPEPKEEPEPAPAAEAAEKPRAVHVGVGLAFLDRRWFYEDDLFGALSRYRSPLAPHLALEAELFPGAFVSSGPASWFGISGSIDFLVGVTAIAADGTRFPTSSLRVKANLGARIPVADRLEIGVTIGYALTTYSITGDVATKPNVPDVAYSALRPAASLAVRLFGPLWVKAGGSYQILLGTGQLGSAEYFPRLTGGGMDIAAGLLVRPFKFLEVRAMYDYQRFWFSMNPEVGDPYVAGGALDDARGFSVYAAFTL